MAGLAQQFVGHGRSGPGGLVVWWSGSRSGFKSGTVCHCIKVVNSHVEPTFNWTLRDPKTGQPLAHSLVTALYRRLFDRGERRPIGWAMSAVSSDVGTSRALWDNARTAAK